MATKKKTNTISALYKTIDQKQLSEQAKETLKKLRLATGNFRSKNERANEAFNAFYTKLLEKKPSAVKTTKEYKDMVRQRQVEHMKKIREARKEKEESKKGQGNDRDAARPAKPYGWRLRGKHNYRKPTLKQIRDGEAYYEGRVNRADVKRRKFPMLEKGGYMANGGEITYAVVDENTDRIYIRSNNENFIKLKFNELKEIYPQDKLRIIKFEKGKYMGQYAEGGYMEHGGDVDKGGMIYALREYVSSGEIANKTDVLNYDDIAKIRRIAIQYYMDNGDVPYSFGELNRIMAYANDKFKSGYMENGGSMEHEYKVTLQNSDSGDIEIVNVLANSIQEAENKAIEESGLNGYEVIKTMKYAKGGMTDHNLMIGDTIKQSFGNILVVENDGKTYLVNINTGQRWTDSEWWSLSKGEITKYTKMAEGGNVYSSDDAYEAIILKDGVEVDRVVLRAKNKGEARMIYEDYHEGKMMKTHGEDITYEIIVAPSKMAKGGGIKYSTYDNKSMEYIEGEIAHTERSARQFQQMGDYESMEDRKEHVRKLREIYNRKRAESKMAKGGVVYTDLKDIPNLMDRVERGYVTYRGLGAFKEGTEITVDGKKYIVTDDDFNSIARDKDGNMRIRFSAPSRKRYEDGGYMAESGEVFYKESHKMGH
jgi:hypothetical protein